MGAALSEGKRKVFFITLARTVDRGKEQNSIYLSTPTEDPPYLSAMEKSGRQKREEKVP